MTTRTASSIAGKSLVFTGNFERMSRAEIEIMADEMGASVSGNVSKSTDMLVAGDKPGDSKLAKARAFGAMVISEAAFFELVCD